MADDVMDPQRLMPSLKAQGIYAQNNDPMYNAQLRSQDPWWMHILKGMYSDIGMGPMGMTTMETQPIQRGLNEIINARNSMYHATDIRGFNGIMDAGAIHPLGDPTNTMELVSGQGGVSVSRVPRVASKGDKAISFVLDPEKMPETRPFTEEGYKKTDRYSPNAALKMLTPEEQNAFDLAGKQGNGRLQNDIVNQAQRRLGSIPNKQFEFENRTFNQSIPLSAAKGIVIDKKALTRAITNDPEGHWPSQAGPEPDFDNQKNVDALVDYHIKNIQRAAQSKGLPLRVAENGRQLHSYRAGLSKLPSTQPLYGAVGGLGAYELLKGQGDQNGR